MTTTIVGEDGERIVGTPLGQSSPAYAPIMEGKAYFGEANIVGRPFYTAYQPIFDQTNKPVGIVFVGIDKGQIEAVVYDAVKMLLVVGLATLAVLGAVGYLLSRLMMAPVPKLAKTMKAVAEGDYNADVPFIEQGNEVGEMARAVEVFRENGLKVSQMTEEERAASQRRRIERTDMMVALQAAFGEVVDAAIAGDFSKRVHAQFADPELNSLAGSVNNLVETVDRGITETGEVLAALADTNLTKRMEGDYQGSFAKLKGDTNAVADKLTDVVTQLRATSRTLKTATGEILSGANDLSERTTKQAATIEETSAAMEQLASTVADNARMAEDANGKAQSVSQSAAHSGATMSEANQAMERITSSSAKISNIIGMIDDIAFQTNLLALNASVEAARAGDAGKGFAVVAVEVRRLAQSAASASADVKALIEQSANEVMSGSKLVSNASEQLTAMLDAVNQNASLMQSIAKASREQAAAIDEVSVAVRTLDEMTQHNAALVEQTNAAIEQTEAQASELDRVVDIFTIGDTAEAAPMRSPARSAATPAREAADKVRSAARSYLTQGNAAIAKDWAEF
jgi:methyl-accepting chemotaxis protein